MMMTDKSKAPPPPFDQLDWTHYHGNGQIIEGRDCWWWPDPYGPSRVIYLFSPKWEGGWPGKGYWRFAANGQMSACKENPADLLPEYVAYLLTGALK